MLAKPAFCRTNIRTFVNEVAQAGKSNAWNHLVHRFCNGETDFIILLDADIRIPESTALQLMVEALSKSDTAVVAIDESVKDLSLAPKLTLIDRLILKASGTAHDTRTALAGGCYCAKFKALREVWMPLGLPAEDGFLRAMLLTSSFTKSEHVERLIFVAGARHVFESERGFQAVFRHNVRLAIGTAINVFLFHHFRETPRNSQDLAQYIRSRNDADENWINRLISEQIRKGRYFIVPTSLIWKRPNLFLTFPMRQRMKKAPIFLFGFIFDLAVYLRANHLMRRGTGAGFW